MGLILLTNLKRRFINKNHKGPHHQRQRQDSLNLAKQFFQLRSKITTENFTKVTQPLTVQILISSPTSVDESQEQRSKSAPYATMTHLNQQTIPTWSSQVSLQTKMQEQPPRQTSTVACLAFNSNSRSPVGVHEEVAVEHIEAKSSSERNRLIDILLSAINIHNDQLKAGEEHCIVGFGSFFRALQGAKEPYKDIDLISSTTGFYSLCEHLEKNKGKNTVYDFTQWHKDGCELIDMPALHGIKIFSLHDESIHVKFNNFC